MNIIENIHRSHQMMGVINEDTRKNAVNRMIDTMGLSGTIDFLGGYDPILDDIVTKDDKISYIRGTVEDIADDFGGGIGFSVHEIGLDPVEFSRTDEEEQLIEYLTPYVVEIDTYGGYKYDSHLFNFPLKYEDLEDEMFDEVFRFIIECKQHVDIIRLE